MKRFLFNCLAAASLLVLSFAHTSCENSGTDDAGDLQLHYPTVIDIGPSMNFISGAPSYYGPKPSDFAIESITLNGENVECPSFTITPENGSISLSNTDAMDTGTYKLTVSCTAGGRYHLFCDIFVVEMVPAAPVDIELSVDEVKIAYVDLANEDLEIQVIPVGESVSITGWSLIQPEGEEYFAISKTGVITFNSNFTGEILPGIYPLTIGITTTAGKMFYTDRLTIHITSKPLEITYPSAAGRMEYGMSFRSLTPSVKGSPENIVWSIAAVSPDDGGAVAVDPETGVISVEEGNELAVDNTYVIDLAVSNDYGTTEFAEAFQLTVIAYIAPIDPATFSYTEIETIQGGEFTAAKADGFTGDEAVFSFGELPAGVEGQITIDEATGTVSAKRGHTIPLGTYAIPVKAVNTKSEAETTLTLKVIENPYYFTKIVYGNNLDLTPAENYANQFRYAKKNDFANAVLTPATDAKEGVQLEWSVQIKHQCSALTIDKQTGVITPSGDGFKANNGGLILVTATAGKGTVGETSVTVPVFFSFIQELDGVTVHYAPFAFQVNPRTGGTSAVPKLTLSVDESMFLLDYRRTFNFYNFNGPEWHDQGGALTATNYDNLLGEVWRAFYSGIGSATANYGSKDPISYYSNASRLPSALCYVDPTTKAVVVNPNKWIDSYGNYANGAFIAQMTFVTDGNSGGVNNGSQIFPLWIWFDENF